MYHDFWFREIVTICKCHKLSAIGLEEEPVLAK